MILENSDVYCCSYANFWPVNVHTVPCTITRSSKGPESVLVWNEATSYQFCSHVRNPRSSYGEARQYLSASLSFISSYKVLVNKGDNQHYEIPG